MRFVSVGMTAFIYQERTSLLKSKTPLLKLLKINIFHCSLIWSHVCWLGYLYPWNKLQTRENTKPPGSGCWCQSCEKIQDYLGSIISFDSFTVLYIKTSNFYVGISLAKDISKCKEAKPGRKMGLVYPAQLRNAAWVDRHKQSSKTFQICLVSDH